MIAERLPSPLRRFFTGWWPTLWVGLVCAYGLLAHALPDWLDARKAWEEAGLQRALVAKQLEVAARAPAEEAKREALAAWWGASAPMRFRAANVSAASARLQDHVRKAFDLPGLRVEKLEQGKIEPLGEGGASNLVVLNVTVTVERMESLARALESLETPAEGGRPWLRIGNMKATALGVRLITGVRMDATLYAWVEAGGGA